MTGVAPRTGVLSSAASRRKQSPAPPAAPTRDSPRDDATAQSNNRDPFAPWLDHPVDCRRLMRLRGADAEDGDRLWSPLAAFRRATTAVIHSRSIPTTRAWPTANTL